MSVKVDDLKTERRDNKEALEKEVRAYLNTDGENTMQARVWTEVTRSHHDETDSWYACEDNYKRALQ